MTTPEEAARMELTPPGRDVSQAESDRWFKGGRTGKPNMALWMGVYNWMEAHPGKFDPMQPISPLAVRLLAASNALCRDRVPHGWGGHFSPVGETRHWGKK